MSVDVIRWCCCQVSRGAGANGCNAWHDIYLKDCKADDAPLRKVVECSPHQRCMGWGQSCGCYYDPVSPVCTSTLSLSRCLPKRETSHTNRVSCKHTCHM